MVEETALLENALAALRSKSYTEALAALVPLLDSRPHVGRLWALRAQIALGQDDPASARRYALYAMANEDLPMGLGLLGKACESSGETEGAYEAYALRAGRLSEDMDAAIRAGTAAWNARLSDLALEWYNEAARRAPEHADPWTNRGFVLKSRGDISGALRAYEEGIRRSPADANLRWNRAQLLLMVGQYEEGLREAEWRWKKAVFPSKPRGFAQPLWMGEPVDTLLIHGEQGFGDCLQMLRYVPLAAQKVGRVILEIQPELYRLMSVQSQEGDLFPANVSVVIQGKPPLPLFDAQVPMMTLPLSLGLFDLAHPPLTRPHLTCKPGIEFTDKSRPDRLLNVGFCWRGRPTFAHNHLRSFGLEDMAPLFGLPGIRWLSLQKTPDTDVAAELKAAGVDAMDLGASAQDFLDTASYLKSLDLFITTDTSVAHLAGALGVETWVAVMAIPDWRWAPGGEQCVWYDSVKLFRQETTGNWAPVFARMRECLQKYLAKVSSDA